MTQVFFAAAPYAAATVTAAIRAGLFGPRDGRRRLLVMRPWPPRSSSRGTAPGWSSAVPPPPWSPPPRSTAFPPPASGPGCCSTASPRTRTATASRSPSSTPPCPTWSGTRPSSAGRPPSAGRRPPLDWPRWPRTAGYRMQTRPHPALRPEAEDWLRRHLPRHPQYFKRHRLTSLRLPGGSPVRAEALRRHPALRRIVRTVRIVRACGRSGPERPGGAHRAAGTRGRGRAPAVSTSRQAM